MWTSEYKTHCIKIGSASHPVIIDRETFDTVQRLREKNRKKKPKEMDSSVLGGLLFCNDCVKRMRHMRDGNRFYYTCTTYQIARQRFDSACTRHSISQRVIEQIALAKIQETAADVRADKKAFAERVQKASNKDNERALKLKTAEIAKSEKRVAELDNIIKRIFEDKVATRLSEERAEKMMSDYEQEQKTLIVSVELLKVEGIKKKTASVESFFKLVEQQSEITELTPTIARTFIQKIVHSRSRKNAPSRTCRFATNRYLF